VLLIAAGYATGRLSGPQPPDMQQLQAALAQAQANPPTAPRPPMTPYVSLPAPPTPAPLPAVNNNIYALTRSLSLGSRSGSTGTVLVIPSGQTRTEDLITINEDMSVMSRIFQKNLAQARISTARSSIFVSRHDPFSMLMGGRGEIQIKAGLIEFGLFHLPAAPFCK